MTKHEKTVLVVDDDLEIAQVLVRTLRQHGYTALMANDGLEALELIEDTHVDVLLSDIDMPGIDGVTLAMRVRERMPNIVRILLTGNARLDTALVAINRGEVHRYLTKPWVAEELLRTIDEAFSRLAELARLATADQSVLRRRAALDALEGEYPGITQLNMKAGAYVVDPSNVAGAHDMLADTDLGPLLKPHP